MTRHISRYMYRLRPGAGPEYDEKHKAVWPELRELLKQSGVLDYEIWRHEEIVVCELHTTLPLRETTALLAASEIQQRWSESLAFLFERTADDAGNPLFLRESFRLET